MKDMEMPLNHGGRDAQSHGPKMAVSVRANEIMPFIVMDVMEASAEMERQGCTIIHLEVGERRRDSLHPQHGPPGASRSNLPSLPQAIRSGDKP